MKEKRIYIKQQVLIVDSDAKSLVSKSNSHKPIDLVDLENAFGAVIEKFCDAKYGDTVNLINDPTVKGIYIGKSHMNSNCGIIELFDGRCLHWPISALQYTT